MLVKLDHLPKWGWKLRNVWNHHRKKQWITMVFTINKEWIFSTSSSADSLSNLLPWIWWIHRELPIDGQDALPRNRRIQLATGQKSPDNTSSAKNGRWVGCYLPPENPMGFCRERERIESWNKSRNQKNTSAFTRMCSTELGGSSPAPQGILGTPPP